MELTIIKDQFVNMVERLKENWEPFLVDRMIIKKRDPDLQDLLVEARKEWIEAHKYFDNVSEPELVDHASYLIRAAESKYMYLLKQVKER